MAENAPTVNSMVFDYLKSVSVKIANSFKKQVTDVQDLPEGSPKLAKVIESYGKRKITDEGYGSNNGTPSKKAKLNGTSNGKKPFLILKGEAKIYRNTCRYKTDTLYKMVLTCIIREKRIEKYGRISKSAYCPFRKVLSDDCSNLFLRFQILCW